MRRRRRRKHTLQAIFMIFSLICLCIVGYLAYLQFQPMVVKAVTMEAGAPMVEVEEFLLEKDLSGRYVTDISALDLSAPGIYDIRIKVRNRVHTSSLEIVDSIAPYADPQKVTALKGEVVQAKSFVTNVLDATTVRVDFVEKPDTTVAGNQEVAVILMDTSGNSFRVSSELTVLDVKSRVQVEAGSAIDTIPEDFLDHDKYDISFVTNIKDLDASKPTIHEIQMNVDGRLFTSEIEVVDTTPPTATGVDQTIWLNDKVDATSFVTDIKDVSGVQFAFKNEPDSSIAGSQEVIIILTDSYNNVGEVSAQLHVKEDKEPPVFTGIRNKTVYEGEGVAYKKGISVSDNRDKEVTYKVDSSQVNLKKAGVYNVYYSASDSSGNKNVVTATVTVLKFMVTDAMLNELTDPILDKITTDSMTKLEKAYEIYKYVKSHVGYTGDSDKSDWKNEAYRGLKNGIGDCFTYYAVSEALLTRAGIDNMRVTRVGGRTQHFWNLVNCGDGWYHFDTCPHKDKVEAFMMTDAEVEAYTIKRGNNYYNFDKSLYPATPEE